MVGFHGFLYRVSSAIAARTIPCEDSFKRVPLTANLQARHLVDRTTKSNNILPASHPARTVTLLAAWSSERGIFAAGCMWLPKLFVPRDKLMASSAVNNKRHGARKGCCFGNLTIKSDTRELGPCRLPKEHWVPTGRKHAEA